MEARFWLSTTVASTIPASSTALITASNACPCWTKIASKRILDDASAMVIALSIK